jgi:16S rRNA (cytosine1402-N4)-methyltransferase
MCFHTPVLVDEAMGLLITNPSGIYVDATAGGGGHSEAILRRLDDKGRLIGIDRDREAIAICRDKLQSDDSRARFVHGDFKTVDRVLFDLSINRIDGFFFDLGVSSHQLDRPERGFSYLTEGPLDMRMDNASTLTARDVINGYKEADLSNIFIRYGEEHHARQIARKIIEKRKKGAIETTTQLVEVVARTIPYRHRIKTLSRVWQALRFEVNSELDQLRVGLEKVYSFLKIKGRIVVISYESLMDRMVKRFFRGQRPDFSRAEEPVSRPGYKLHMLTRRVIRPTDEEIRQNPRSRSARLRAAEKVDESKGNE